MNPMKLFLRRSPVAFALFAGFFLIPAGRAQLVPQLDDSRYLFIFDTSADMKKRLPAIQAEVNELMSTSMGGHLRMGDTIGVWTFDRDLRTGQLPLLRWNPDDAVTIATGINKLVRKQHYADVTHFSVLQPQLNEVIRNSGRLTVVIFCDGKDGIKWTPYDAGINQVFQQRLAEQQRTRQPFVLVLRTQSGKYVGCTMNFPPGMVSVPEFPPPAPPAPVKTPPPAPPVKPPMGPPLFIIGTTVVTNWPPPPAPLPPTNPAPVTPTKIIPAPPANSVAPTNTAMPTNPVAPPPPTNPAPMIQTNAAAALTANPSAPTNSMPVATAKPAAAPPPNLMTPTNAVAPPTETSGSDRKGALAIGGALLVAAGALVALAVFRGRRNSRGSLITRSMRKD